jgi:hypothetical protein
MMRHKSGASRAEIVIVIVAGIVIVPVSVVVHGNDTVSVISIR